MNDLAHKILSGEALTDGEKLAAALSLTGIDELPQVLEAFRIVQSFNS